MAVFVGRAQELRQLERRFLEALGGRGGAVFITGEAGAGKSSLTERFLVDAALWSPGALVIATGCSEQYGAAEPYQPFVEAFRDLAYGGERAAGRKSFGELARKLAPYWVQAIPVAGDVIAATMVTAAELKGSLGGATATAAPPSEEALFFQYTELFLAALAEHPILLFIDDLHWADRASVSLLAHLARKVADKPALIIGTYRPADVEVSQHPIKQAKLELERYGVAVEVALQQFDSADLAEFVQEELGGPPTPELLHLLEHRAGANPLFFGELLRWLVEQGYARDIQGEWGLAQPPEAIEIPRSVESVIEKRLSRLDPELYRVLEYASVEGDEFDSAVLAQLLDMDELELEERLDPLVRRDKLIRLAETRELPTGEPTSVYEFSHTLIQDVLHNSVQGKRRILLHRKVAEILEEIYATETESVAHKLAIHFDEGRLPERACEFALLAAGRASLVFAHWDAIELLQRALRNSQTDECKVEVLERLGEEQRLVGHLAQALEVFSEALEIAASRGERLRTLRLRRRLAKVERVDGSRTAQELLAQLEVLAQEARASGELAELCQILWHLGTLPGSSTAAGQEALEIAQALGDPVLVAKAHYLLAYTLAVGGNPTDAITHARQALEFYRDQEDKILPGQCYNALGIAHTLLGDYRRAVESFNAAAIIFEEVADPADEAMVRNNLGQLLIQMGDWAGAEENLREAIRLFRRMDATAKLLHPLENMARLYSAKGDDEAARQGWQELLELGQAMGYWDTEIVARCGLGVLHLEDGDLESARAELAAARQLMPEDEGWPDYREDLELFAARLAAAEGSDAEALEILERVEQELAGRDRYFWATYRLFHAELVSRSDPTRAGPIAQEALDVFEQLGAEPMRQRAASLLARIGGES